MFKYDINETYKVYSFGDNENPLKILATTSNNEEELFELLKIKNPFINEISNNEYKESKLKEDLDIILKKKR